MKKQAITKRKMTSFLLVIALVLTTIITGPGSVIAADLYYPINGSDLLTAIENASDGDTIFLSGEYEIDETLFVYAPNVTIKGDGTAVIKPSDSFSAINVMKSRTYLLSAESDNFKLESVKFDIGDRTVEWPSTPTTTKAINAINIYNVVAVIDDVYVTGGGIGLNLNGGITDLSDFATDGNQSWFAGLADISMGAGTGIPAPKLFYGDGVSAERIYSGPDAVLMKALTVTVAGNPVKYGEKVYSSVVSKDSIVADDGTILITDKATGKPFTGANMSNGKTYGVSVSRTQSDIEKGSFVFELIIDTTTPNISITASSNGDGYSSKSWAGDDVILKLDSTSSAPSGQRFQFSTGTALTGDIEWVDLFEETYPAKYWTVPKVPDEEKTYEYVFRTITGAEKPSAAKAFVINIDNAAPVLTSTTPALAPGFNVYGSNVTFKFTDANLAAGKVSYKLDGVPVVRSNVSIATVAFTDNGYYTDVTVSDKFGNSKDLGTFTIGKATAAPALAALTYTDYNGNTVTANNAKEGPVTVILAMTPQSYSALSAAGIQYQFEDKGTNDWQPIGPVLTKADSTSKYAFTVNPVLSGTNRVYNFRVVNAQTGAASAVRAYSPQINPGLWLKLGAQTVKVDASNEVYIAATTNVADCSVYLDGATIAFKRGTTAVTGNMTAGSSPYTATVTLKDGTVLDPITVNIQNANIVIAFISATVGIGSAATPYLGGTAWVNKSPVYLKAVVNANAGQLARIEYSKDDGKTWTSPTLSTSSTSTAIKYVDVTASGNQSTTYQFRAVSLSGKINAVKTFKVNIDTVAPAITYSAIRTPADNLVFTAKEDVKYTYSFKALGSDVLTTTTSVNFLTSPWALTLSASGTYTNIYAVDRAGNKSKVVAGPLVVNKTTPTLTITPSVATGKLAELEVSIAMNGSAASDVIYQVRLTQKGNLVFDWTDFNPADIDTSGGVTKYIVKKSGNYEFRALHKISGVSSTVRTYEAQIYQLVW